VGTRLIVLLVRRQKFFNSPSKARVLLFAYDFSYFFAYYAFDLGLVVAVDSVVLAYALGHLSEAGILEDV